MIGWPSCLDLPGVSDAAFGAATIDGVTRQSYKWAVSQGSDAVNRKVKREGGYYCVCWCYGGLDDGVCVVANDFGVDGATMTLRGPLYGQTRT